MNCPEVKKLLSDYYDGELADDLRIQVGHHVDHCADCAQELHGFERLSRMANALSSPSPPEQIWQRIETELGQEQDSMQPTIGMAEPKSTRKRIVVPALMVTILMFAGMGWLIFRGSSPHGEHEHFTADFAHYLAEFHRDPNDAQQFLLSKYENSPVEPEQAIEFVGYRPAIADGMPPEFTIASMHVLKMPCCVCVQCLCRRSDGSALAVFEHNDDDARWFEGHPSIEVNCESTQCSLVELPGSIAASWKRGDRYVTLVGVRELSEVSELVGWLDKQQSALSK